MRMVLPMRAILHFVGAGLLLSLVPMSANAMDWVIPRERADELRQPVRRLPNCRGRCTVPRLIGR